jgi:hypothetical protein
VSISPNQPKNGKPFTTDFQHGDIISDDDFQGVVTGRGWAGVVPVYFVQAYDQTLYIADKLAELVKSADEMRGI